MLALIITGTKNKPRLPRKLRQIKSRQDNRRFRRLPPDECPSHVPVGKRGSYKETVIRATIVT